MINTKIDISKIYLISKERLCEIVLLAGFLLAYYSTLYPWFLWPIKNHAGSLAGLILMGMLFMLPKAKALLTRTDFLLPLILFIFLDIYEHLAGQGNFLGFITIVFRATTLMVLFRLSIDYLPKLMHVLTIVMAVLQVFAIFGFMLYLAGFTLPSRDVSFDNEFYYFTNYFFFLLDDRSLFSIVPRFQSYFIEPNYHGTACVLLLLYQSGKWKKWYNIVLLVATLLSFSLSAYVLLVVTVFLNMWRQGKNVIKSLLITSIIIGSGVAGTFLYNDGDNLVHDLILMRLEIEDGELAGNNRITDNFKNEYENYLKSGDIMFGRDRDMSEFGNSGYQVYIYENGLVGLFLLLSFYIAATYKAENKRNLISAYILAALIFGVNGYITWYQIFIPIFCTAYAGTTCFQHHEGKEKEDDESIETAEDIKPITT